MEAGSFLRSPIPLSHKQPLRRRIETAFPRFVRASISANSDGRYRGPKPRRNWVADWVSKNDEFVRSMPIYVGGASLLAVLFNRTISGVAPVADASSSQSRADLLTLGLAVTNILSGLVWLSIRPKSISMVSPEGIECQRINPQLPTPVVSELLWIWESLSDVTCCRSLVVVYDSSCILQIGFAAKSSDSDGEAVSVDASTLKQGSLYQGVMKSGARKYILRDADFPIEFSITGHGKKQDLHQILNCKANRLLECFLAENYLANLSLFPGRSELPFLPSNTQAVILQPLGDRGIAIIGGDTIRGFTSSDQTWISLIGEKLDATLAKYLENSPFAVVDQV